MRYEVFGLNSYFYFSPSLKMSSSGGKLDWTSSQRNMLASFNRLRLENVLCDVTVATEGRYTKAHKMVLCACSQYFRSELVFSY